MDEYYKPNDLVGKYSIIKIIGIGRYGIVYLAEDKNEKKVIIKQLKKEMLAKYPSKVVYEEQTLKSLNSHRFPKLLEKLFHKDNMLYIMEYIEGKNFEDIIIREEYEFTKKEIYTIANQLIEIINILHENNIAHRDIRVPNVILDNDNKLVLIDFGLARFINEKDEYKEMDYWYLSDFLIHLYYTAYSQEEDNEERPWFEELDLDINELIFLKKLMGLDGKYNNIVEIKRDFDKINSTC